MQMWQTDRMLEENEKLLMNIKLNQLRQRLDRKIIQISLERHSNQANGLKLKTRRINLFGNFPKNARVTVPTYMYMYTKLTCCHTVNQIGTLWLHYSYYTVVGGMLVPSANE